jgi:hypothetical protein
MGVPRLLKELGGDEKQELAKQEQQMRRHREIR